MRPDLILVRLFTAEYWRLLGNVPAGVTLNLVRASRSDR